ncbi:MAG TPA: hypothetical protein VFN41_04010 [Candidatus Limnocylindrales bacterium]|nr:hypothetical protein [Candidatus Limnocylindrales bacterium]
MSRRTATLSLLLGLVAALALALPVLAKTGAEARLDTTLHRDATPGSTIAVAWSLIQVVDDKESPFSTQGVYMRLVGVDGKSSTEVVGTETPFGSGHYKATIQVPVSGIGEVVVGMKGESCTQTDGCSRMDVIFPLTDDRLVTGYAPAPKPAAPIASARPVASAAPAPTAAPSTASSASMSSQLAPLVAIGIAIAIAAGATALLLGRRRALDAPAGR